MTLEHILAFNLALIAAMLSPGPALLVAIRTALSAGRTAGIAVGAGLALMASTWTLAALLGLDVAFRLFPWAYGAAKVLGASYLLYIACKMWINAAKGIDVEVLPARHAFREGFLINLFNPKSVLFAAAVLIVVLPAEMSAWENAFIVANHLLLELLFYSLLAAGISLRAVARRYLAARVYIDRASSILLGALGLRLLGSRL